MSARRSYGRILQGLLAVVGIVLFALLARKVDLTELAALDLFPLLLILIALLAAVNYFIETLGWWLVCGEKAPSIWTLMSIRARGEAITNLLPGGALIGEPMKIALLARATGKGRAESATLFLLSKLITIGGHVLYVITAVALSWSAINGGSSDIFGTSNLATIVLCAALAIFLSLVVLLLAMVWLRPLKRWLRRTGRTGRWSERWNTIVDELHHVEEMLGVAVRTQGGRILLGLLCCFVAWGLNAVEAFMIVHWLDAGMSFMQSYAIDGVSSVVRMIVFVLPIGIGGQDWAITGLMAIHGVADPVGTAASVVVLKRAREFFVIGIGLVLFVLNPQSRAALDGLDSRTALGDERSIS